MSINSNIEKQLQDKLNEKIVSNEPVSGGCIADSRIITTDSGSKYFLKSHSGTPGMFRKEANGLSELAKAKSIRIPKVILHDETFLLLECISTGSKTVGFFENFATELAQMHRFTAADFGFFEDNYIGANPQYNLAVDDEKTDWACFYFNKRILPQVKMAEKQGYGNADFTKLISSFENKLPQLLNDSNEPPTLLHGDLWGGNYMCDNKGNAVLIDPAVYYGHREADLAMTKMFGGFAPTFYAAYQKAFPLSEGWKYRENIYLLYHYLNHLNLFGGSYLGSVINILKFYQ